MNQFFVYCFDKWLRPILFLVCSLLLVISNRFFDNQLFWLSITLFLIGLVGMLISTIYQLVKRRWWKGILSAIILIGTIVSLVIYVLTMFFIETVDGDKWADNLKIPTNIPIDTPIDLTLDYKRPDSVLALIKSETDFQLYNSFQPGLYEYDFWIGKIDSGTIYLKAYEITQSYALSTDYLPERSAIQVYNPTDSIRKFSTTTNFTIYEGDWGQPYAARFEVWFKPANGGKERKLFNRNYKIEGWQR